MACLDWKIVIISIVIANGLQIIFEAGALYALEITFKPTSLDRVLDPEKYQADMGE
jgi:hypothetical protein